MGANQAGAVAPGTTAVRDAKPPRLYIVPMSETSLPAAPVLIQAAQAAMREASGTRHDPLEAASRALDQYAPAIDELTDLAGAAGFLGLTYDSVRRKQHRTRVDGTREWPAPDGSFGQRRSDRRRAKTGGWTSVWRYRTIVLHLAQAPGRGHPGMPGRRAEWRAEQARTVDAASQPE